MAKVLGTLWPPLWSPFPKAAAPPPPGPAHLAPFTRCSGGRRRGGPFLRRARPSFGGPLSSRSVSFHNVISVILQVPEPFASAAPAEAAIALPRRGARPLAATSADGAITVPAPGARPPAARRKDAPRDFAPRTARGDFERLGGNAPGRRRRRGGPAPACSAPCTTAPRRWSSLSRTSGRSTAGAISPRPNSCAPCRAGNPRGDLLLSP